jgi:hypothetical protein
VNYYEINTMPLVDPSYCFLDGEPKGTNMFTHRMAGGYAMGDKYPADAKMYMEAENPGTELPSLIGNTNDFLIVTKAIQEILKATGVDMECLPFTLYDHKKREASRDYFIVNPLGTFDCMNLKASELEYSGEDIVGVDRIVLSRKKLESAPDFFRIQEVPDAYVISARVAAEIQKLQPTNFYITKMEVPE